MNQNRVNRTRTAMQSGFTLIELIVVMVILGILAATALPRFIDLGSDARVATLNGARGAVSSTVAMLHGKWLAAGSTGNVVTEGITVTMDANGYPDAADSADFMAVAGITATDYTIIAPGTAATANSPATGATEIAIIPRSAAGSPTGLTCFIRYTQANPPTLSATPAAAAC